MLRKPYCGLLYWEVTIAVEEALVAASVEEAEASVALEVVAAEAVELVGLGNLLNHAKIELDRTEVYLDAAFCIG